MSDQYEEYSKDHILEKLRTSNKWVVNALATLIKNDEVEEIDSELFEKLNDYRKSDREFTSYHISLIRLKLYKRYVDKLYDIANYKY